ncbi:MAG TPA: dTMP kinase [Bacteroidales bacterium]|nr:dTMP kinase [Bacteroidales bacterium]
MRLIVIEGVDGSGKSTQLKLLNRYFVSKGCKCEFLHFPRTGAPYFGELIARFLRGEFGSLSEVDPYLVALLYAGDRKDASEMITNWLDDNRIVLLDRYTYSNIAYQCAKLEDTSARTRLMKWILSLEFTHFAIPRPGLNIFLDVPFSFTEGKLKPGRAGKDRSYLNGSGDIHEASLDFQRKVRDVYLEIAQTENDLEVIDCCDHQGSMLSPAAVSSLIIQKITERNIIHNG